MDYANMFLVPLKPVVLFVQWIRLHTNEEMCTQIGYIKKTQYIKSNWS